MNVIYIANLLIKEWMSKRSDDSCIEIFDKTINFFSATLRNAPLAAAFKAIFDEEVSYSGPIVNGVDPRIMSATEIRLAIKVLQAVSKTLQRNGGVR